ncbi:hypothetical protein GCM10007390_31230 [Persicitalea jodogahamensis]|uniref:Carbohydrate-binding protein n=2 Tax=Persicitalea jodogahamensis TaxID=402147 RepID=A0A8J3GAM9_9BACT|nr:hypothetical protein GCM10007390_31230 [Persicitalea jodogahamensis]
MLSSLHYPSAHGQGNSDVSSHAARPEDNRFTVEVLDKKLNEPMELTVLPDSRVIFVERRGNIRLYDPKQNKTRLLAHLPIYLGSEDGLLGVTKDPHFERTNWLYFFYSPAGEKAVQRIARFTMKDDSLLLSSEKVLLEFPLLRACCHSGGSLAFGPDGNLFISAGDNTYPSASSGFAPLDERADRIAFDSQKSAANTDDLRGKILRITPQSDGTYTIPDDNLFPKDGTSGRPEIYTMGNRNPFRISIDPKTSYLYWGEVGPDAGTDSLHRGPKGYDEINQARQAGNFGWPYFIGDNKPYRPYNFATQQSGELFDALAPVNTSVNNTGAKTLPPAQKAFIWYPYLASPEFPEAGEGGRTAMAGPVFYTDQFASAPYSFPPYYDGKLLIYDWMRNWIKAVTMDNQGNYQKMEPFLPTRTFSKPVDMEFGPDGSLYVLEYGTFWKSENEDSQLIRIQYHKNNRRPIARISADKMVGAAPLTVKLSSKGSFDYDKEDSLAFVWKLKDGTVISRNSTATYTFKKPGTQEITLAAIDPSGETAQTTLEVKVGNAPPVVRINTTANRSFYWGKQDIPYQVRVEDQEDDQRTPANLNRTQIRFDYLPQGKDLALLTSTSQSDNGKGGVQGKQLITQSGCTGCHAYDKRTVGPGFIEISQRYLGKNKRQELVDKVQNGGSGNWGEVAMAAHPQLKKEVISEMIDYILTLSDEKKVASLPMTGVVSTGTHGSEGGTYYLTATYTDQGANGIEPLTGRDTLLLRSPIQMAYDADTSHGVMIRKADGRARFTQNDAFIAFRRIDLSQIHSLSIRASASDNIEGTLEIRVNGEKGPVISQKSLSPGSKWVNFDMPIKPMSGFQNLYFIYKTTSKTIGIWQTFDLSAITFRRKSDEE